jgi:ligand-binding SRPBCC domain-containing protein
VATAGVIRYTSPMSGHQHLTHAFTVRAPVADVADFHGDTVALQRLTPPPVWVQLGRVEPLSDGSVAEFTLWFGPLPIRWVAVHSDVDPRHGFTDTQQAGPLRHWRHVHRFEALDAGTTRVTERLEYAHHADRRGWLTRVLFNAPALRLMFMYRGLITRRALERAPRPRFAHE